MSHAQLPDFLFYLFLAAEIDQGRAARLSRIETLLDLPLDEHLQISVNLFRQLLFLPDLLEQVAQETGKTRQQRHDLFSLCCLERMRNCQRDTPPGLSFGLELPLPGFRQAIILGPAIVFRSEEHTSELQSQSNLVCRLLLEKKNTL